jgi:methyl-accepting chemotaxis protein
MKIFNNLSFKWYLLAIIFVLIAAPLLVTTVINVQTVTRSLQENTKFELSQQAQILNKTVSTSEGLVADSINDALATAKMVVLIGYNSARKIYLDETKKDSIYAVNQITNTGQNINVPGFMINERKMLFDTKYVDDVKKSVGTDCTIFQVIPNGLLRISTTILNESGQRAVGTYIPSDSPVYQAIMKGEEYKGRAFVVKTWLTTGYTPIKDFNGKLVGALFVGKDEASYQEHLKDDFKDLVIGKTGYIYILNTKGDYVLSLKRQRDGENIWESKDANGNLFIQDIVKKAQALKDGEVGMAYYPWKNAGENSARYKYAAFTYFPKWDWIVAASAYEGDFMDASANLRKYSLMVGGISLIIGLFIAYIFALSIVKLINIFKDSFEEVAKGNLGININNKALNRGDEIGDMARASQRMLENFKGVVGVIKKNIATTAASAQQLSASAQQVNASMQQVSSTIQEVAGGAQNVSKNALEVQDISKKTEENANKGGEAALLVSQKMSTINATTKQEAEKIKSLGAMSDKISNIVKTINNISDQTNLLALNAAIEAARAGEAGRGFAVVADEVRKLAEESGKATEQISELIGGIQNEIKSSIQSMEINTKQVDEGTLSVQEALKSFELIPELVDRVTQSLNAMTAVAEQNAAGSDQLAASVQQVTSAMQQVSSAALTLSKGAEDLRIQVSKFKMEKNSEPAGEIVEPEGQTTSEKSVKIKSAESFSKKISE